MGYVLEDCTTPAGRRPNSGEAAVAAYHKWGADLIVAEVNHGGEMVKRIIETTRDSDSVKVQERPGQSREIHQAEPVSALFERHSPHGRLLAKIRGRVTAPGFPAKILPTAWMRWFGVHGTDGRKPKQRRRGNYGTKTGIQNKGNGRLRFDAIDMLRQARGLPTPDGYVVITKDFSQFIEDELRRLYAATGVYGSLHGRCCCRRTAVYPLVGA